MQTILGANGQIGTELAHELHRAYTREIRLVSRRPQRLHDTDELVAADLLDPAATSAAVRGSDVAYLTVGLPADARLWAQQLPVMMRNVIDACVEHDTKLVFFDNTYMYDQAQGRQTEDTAFAPTGSKAVTRAEIATMLLDAMVAGRVEALICRAPEFYGPGKTQGVTNTLVFDRIAAGKKANVPVSDRTRRTLIWTPDASRGMALLGNTASAYGQTWHLPCPDDHPTYAHLMQLSSQAWGRQLGYSVIRTWMFAVGRLFSSDVRELWPLLPRYGVDTIFVSDKFKQAFPDFEITSYRDGVEALHRQAH